MKAYRDKLATGAKLFLALRSTLGWGEKLPVVVNSSVNGGELLDLTRNYDKIAVPYVIRDRG